MSTDERIQQLFEHGVTALTFSRTDGGAPLVTCTQMIGSSTWHGKVVVEATGNTHADALVTLSQKVEHTIKLSPPSRLVRLDPNGN